MPTFSFDGGWLPYAGWNLLAFAASFVPHSFFEWISHRFVLHSKAIVKFAFEEHDRVHHVIYGSDHTFHVQDGKPAYGVDFTARDFILFIVIVMPLWGAAEYLSGKPLLLGAFVSVLVWLNMFNYLHRLYHEPKGSWVEKTWYFCFLKEHHRKHHEDTSRNLNVSFLPIADWALRTNKR